MRMAQNTTRKAKRMIQRVRNAEAAAPRSGILGSVGIVTSPYVRSRWPTISSMLQLDVKAEKPMSHWTQFGLVAGRETHVDRFDLPKMVDQLIFRSPGSEQTIDAADVRIVFVLSFRDILNPDWIPLVEQHVPDAVLDRSGAIVSMMIHEVVPNGMWLTRGPLIVLRISPGAARPPLGAAVRLLHPRKVPVSAAASGRLRLTC